MAMRHFARFAKLSASGTIGRRGWRVRLFATATEARAFARQMTDNGWTVELDNVGDLEPAAPRPR
jgi:hypothetical protein